MCNTAKAIVSQDEYAKIVNQIHSQFAELNQIVAKYGLKDVNFLLMVAYKQFEAEVFKDIKKISSYEEFERHINFSNEIGRLENTIN